MQDMILFKKILSARGLFGITDPQDSVTILVLGDPGDLVTFPQELREGELDLRTPNFYAKLYLTVLRTNHSLQFITKMKRKLSAGRASPSCLL